MVSHITGGSIAYSTACTGADQRKYQSSTSLAFVKGPVTGEFPAQMASNAENASIDDVVMSSLNLNLFQGAWPVLPRIVALHLAS